MERLEDLYLDGLKIYQDDDEYCFTSDAVLLSRFAKVKRGDVIADFCSGSGIVGLHLYGLNKDLIKSVTLFEMQKNLFLLSKKSVEINGLEKIFTPINTRVQEIGKEYNEKFSLIVCNPPYQKLGSGEKQQKQNVAVCHYEIELTLEELMQNVSRCLKFGGRVNMVHRADRLADVIYLMRLNKIEPKKLQLAYAGKSEEPYLMLIEGVKGGKSQLKILKGIKN